VEGETTYTVEEAAALLQETPERVLEMLASGELDGIPPGATVSGEWKVLLPASLGEDQGQEAPVEESAETSPEGQAEGPNVEEGAEHTAEPQPRATEAVETYTANVDPLRGDDATVHRKPNAPSGWVSTQQAARALGISPRTVRWHIEHGNLEAITEGEGVKRSWLVSIDSLQDFRDARQTAGEMPRSYRTPTESVDIASESPGDAIRVLAERLEDAAARAAEYRVRLQLTEQAESTLREELEESRRRQAEAERERDELRRKLEALRERRESPGSPGPSETPTEARGGSQGAPEATQRAAETLRGPEPHPTTGGMQEGPQSPAGAGHHAGRRRGGLWRRVLRRGR
jgi:hypothetical protein